jgi:hypothetical protein
VNISTWPVVKVMVEYGALAGILFLTYVGLCMSRSSNRPLALALFVAFGFTGGFMLLPVTVIQIMFLVCLLRIDDDARAMPDARLRRAPPPARPRPSRPSVRAAAPQEAPGAGDPAAPALRQPGAVQAPEGALQADMRLGAPAP